jgi:hypothetical protein
MSRQKSRWGASHVLLLLAISYLCFFFIPVIISLLTTSLAFVLAHAPFYVLTLVLALIPTLACRTLFVEAVPEKRLGVLVNQGDTFKDLLLPGNYFIMPGKERIKELLTLEPASVQLPVLGLQASDGEIAPQVVIFSWRVQDTIISALSGAYPQQVQDMIVGGRRKMEQEARNHLQAAMHSCALRYNASTLQNLLTSKAHHIFEREVHQEANAYLNPLGLEIERVELMSLGKAPASAPAGSKASAAADEAQKTLAAAYKKLAPLLRSQAFDVTPQQVAESAWNAYDALSGLRKTVNNLNLALQEYTALLLDTLDAISKQRQNAPDQQAIFQARQKTSEELNNLQATIGGLGKLLIDLELQAKQIKAPPFTLTPSEIERLLEVLAAIEQKKLTLEKVYP